MPFAGTDPGPRARRGNKSLSQVTAEAHRTASYVAGRGGAHHGWGQGMTVLPCLARVRAGARRQLCLGSDDTVSLSTLVDEGPFRR